MSGNPDPEEVRQSKRAKVSRTIVIDGHTILRSNNYDLEEGERSVWDQELGADQPEPNNAHL